MQPIDFVKCNYIDAKNLAKQLAAKEWELQKQIKDLQRRQRLIEKVVTNNDEEKMNWIIPLPKEALAERKPIEGKINWKALVWQMIEKYAIPMSSEMVCHKLWLNREEVPFDRKVVLQNVSAALHYLETKDQKLFRTNLGGRKGYVYGLKHQFDFNLNLKQKHLDDYHREAGELELGEELHLLTKNKKNEVLIK